MPTAENGSTVRVDRKELLAALQRVGRVVPSHTCKPILQGICLEASDGSLRLSATDLDVSISVVVEAQGLLPPCVVSCQELTKRIKASNGKTCSIRREAAAGKLIVNGGRVDHTLQTMALGDFPAVPTTSEGEVITIGGLEFQDALATALVGTATEPSRYAINGLLLESDDDGLRLVATDGRRLVTVDLEHADREFRGEVILPRRFAALIGKLVNRKEPDTVRVAVKANADVVMPVNMGLEPSRETLGGNFDSGEQAESSGAEAPTKPAQAVPPDGSNQETPQRCRRRVEHIWPEIGARVDGQFEGETYAALVVAAPKLKAGRALQIINGPALGRVFNSMTAAMMAATARQRQKLGMGTGKKGLPASGWDFWCEPRPQRRLSA